MITLRKLVKLVVPRTIYPSTLLRSAVQRHTGCRIHAGPFRGMQYVERSIWGAYIPKLLGTYELELHEVIEQIVASRPQCLVDIGGAEGYYAVGLLLRLPQASLTVFEQLLDGRQMIRRLAALNDVEDRLHIRNRCDADALRSCLATSDGTVIFCDVEGYEAELLDPSLVRELAGCDILVEVHDAAVPNCAKRLAARFAATHQVTPIAQAPRHLEQYPFDDVFRALWPTAILRYGLNEFRAPETSWLWMQTRLERRIQVARG